MSEDRRDPPAEAGPTGPDRPGKSGGGIGSDAPAETESIAALRRKVDLLGEYGGRREGDWQRLFAKLEGRLEQLERRLGKRDGTIVEKDKTIARLERRTEKLRDRLGEARSRIGALSEELAQRLPPARVRLQVGRSALVTFEDAAGRADDRDEAATPAEDEASSPEDGETEPEAETEAAAPDLTPADEPAEEREERYARELRRLLPSPSIGRSEARIGRVAFYTAVAGNYDLVGEPGVIDAVADYLLFTDQAEPEGVWQPRRFDRHEADNTRTARHVKLHPHRYCAGYDFAVWIDANLRPAALAEAFVPVDTDFDLLAWHHPLRDCVYDEAEEALALEKDDPELIHAQVRRLREEGYPEHAGLIESSVMVINLRRPNIAAFLDDWWQALEEGSRRDQLSFNPTLRRHPEIRLGYLAEQGVSCRNDPRIIYRHHRGPAARAG